MLSANPIPRNEIPWLWNCFYDASLGGHRMSNILEQADCTAQIPSKMLPRIPSPRIKKPQQRNYFHNASLRGLCMSIVLEQADFAARKQILSKMLLRIRRNEEFFYDCLCSFGPWLVLILRETRMNRNKRFYRLNPNPCLIYNPLLSMHFSLPKSRWVEKENALGAKLSFLPIDSNLPSSKCIVSIYTNLEIYVCKLNDGMWLKVDYTFRNGNIGRISDAIFDIMEDDALHLFVIDSVGVVTVFYVMGTDDIRLIHRRDINIIWNDDKFLPPGSLFKLVIDSFGELLVVGKYEEINMEQILEDLFDEEVHLSRISDYILWKGVTVHKLQQEMLVKVDNLDGGMIFVAKAGACYCSSLANSDEFFLKDCVYIMADAALGPNHMLIRFSANQPSLFTTPEVYDLRDNDYPYKYPHWFMPMIS